MSGTAERGKKNRRALLLLGGLGIGMFGFGFAMVPLYGFLCKVTGVQSVELRSSRTAARETAMPVTEDRKITVKFDTNVHPELPWEFHSLTGRMDVQPGKMYEVTFEVTNRSSKTIVGQAIPSVIPWQATGYFSKLECFCFNRQPLAAGETKAMPLRFRVMPDLPGDMNSLTLSYIFMNTHETASEAETDNG